MPPANAPSLRPFLGPVSIGWLAEQGITALAGLQAADAVSLYGRIRAVQPRASLNLLYALVAAQEGSDWRTVARERRHDLLAQLDAWNQAQRQAAGASPA